MLRLLKRTSVGMQPEGIAGIFHGASPEREAVFLRQRKGFVRIAIKAGVGAPQTCCLKVIQGCCVRKPVGRKDKDCIRHQGHHVTGRLLLCMAADIVPVYHIGNSQMFHFWGFKRPSRWLRTSLGVF
jgi:2-acylglycerol O-acyltransferase 2